MRLAPPALLLLIAFPGLAAEPVSPQAFEELSRGRTLHFTLGGQAFGSEQYFDGRRSLWRFADGTCQQGVWHAEGEEVCFVYESNPETQCWRFFRSGAGLSAERVEDGQSTGFVLDLGHSDGAPLPCAGPPVGA